MLYVRAIKITSCDLRLYTHFEPSHDLPSTFPKPMPKFRSYGPTHNINHQQIIEQNNISLILRSLIGYTPASNPSAAIAHLKGINGHSSCQWFDPRGISQMSQHSLSYQTILSSVQIVQKSSSESSPGRGLEAASSISCLYLSSSSWSTSGISLGARAGAATNSS